jgi:aspartyl-tRNA(Asn)/glutamyl-tRNA(Gln) amidotransferase subunit C
VPEQFTVDQVERLALLARLALTSEEKTLFTRQLADFLAYAQQVQQVDTSGIPPTSHAGAVESGSDEMLRGDETRPCLERSDALSQGPETDAGLFKVPRVIG